MNDLIELASAVSPFTIVGEGNVSKRTKEGFAIKASGADLKTMTGSDIVPCDYVGEQIGNFDRVPSIEVCFHTWFMEKFPLINYVAHTHPVETNKILCSHDIFHFASTRLFPDQIVRNGAKSCIVPYATPGIPLMEEIEKSVYEHINFEGYFPKLILLQNHGIIVASTSIKDCIASTMMCEKSAQIYMGAKSLSIKPLTKKNIDAIDTCPKEQYRRSILK